MTGLGVVWLGLFPLWQDGSYAHITRAKGIGMLVLTGLTVLVCAGMIVLLAGQGRLRREVRLTPVHALAAAYFLLVAGSALWGGAADSLNGAGQPTVLFGAKRYEGLYTQLCYALIFLCMSLYPAKTERVLDAAAGVLIAYCAMAALQYAGVNVLGLYPEGRSIRTNYEFQGTIGNIDMVSGYVSLVMPALLAAFVRRRRGGALLLLAGLAGTLLMMCMEVQSGLIVLLATAFLLFLFALHDPAVRARTAIALGGMLTMATLRALLGLPWLDGTAEVVFPHAPTPEKFLPLALAGMLLLLAILLHRNPGRGLRARWVALIAVLLAVAAVAAVYFAPIPAGSGLWEMQEILHGRPQDAFGSERIGIWRLSLELSRLHPLWGTGPDTFLYAMEDHMARTGQTLAQRFDAPHNLLLGILTNNGIPAMIAFVLLCGTLLTVTLRDGRLRPLWMGCLCYLVQGMFTFSICLVTPMFFAMLGMLAGGTARADENVRPFNP